jgi:cation transport ATPase
MRDQVGPSMAVGAVAAFLILFGLGIAFEGSLANKVTFNDPATTVEDWRHRYRMALAFSSGMLAVLTLFWLWQAHKGHGLNSKAGTWLSLLALAVLVSIGLFWFYTSDLREGFGLEMLVIGIASLLAYWISTLFVTPTQYKFTPWLASVFLGPGKNSR